MYTQDIGGRAAGRNLLGRWTRALEGSGSVELQAYYDALDILSSNVVVKSDTYDVQGQHSFGIGDDHRVVWGGGHRHHRDKYFNDSSPGLWPISARPGNPNGRLRARAADG